MRRFCFRLALALGTTVRELLSRIGADELSEWMAYESLEPFSGIRGDLQAGIVASTICNALRGKHGRTVTPGDFLLTFEPKKEKTAAEMESFFRNLTKQMGGVVHEGGAG
jgi:hypothetical protein